MAISEAKMAIVIENYFRQECNVGTSIRSAFEKGFRIGVEKGQIAERRKGKWTDKRTIEHDGEWYCSACGKGIATYMGADSGDRYAFCPNCGADMREGDDNE